MQAIYISSPHGCPLKLYVSFTYRYFKISFPISSGVRPSVAARTSAAASYFSIRLERSSEIYSTSLCPSRRGRSWLSFCLLYTSRLSLRGYPRYIGKWHEGSDYQKSNRGRRPGMDQDFFHAERQPAGRLCSFFSADISSRSGGSSVVSHHMGFLLYTSCRNRSRQAPHSCLKRGLSLFVICILTKSQDGCQWAYRIVQLICSFSIKKCYP